MRRECAPRAGLEIPLESPCPCLSAEFDHDEQRPWPMAQGLTFGTVIVPFESILDILRDASVVTVGVAIALKDADEPLADAAHGAVDSSVRATRKIRSLPKELSYRSIDVRDFCAPGPREEIAGIEIGGPPSRLRRFGGTAYACPNARASWICKELSPLLPAQPKLAEGERRLAGRQGFEPR